MKKLMLWALLISFSLNAWTQDATPIKYAELLTANGAKKHLSILASDKFEGRETGTRGAEKAAKYIAKEFKKIGLQAPVNNTYFQEVKLIKSSFVVSKFQINNQNLTNLKDFYLAGSPNSRSIKSNEIVFAGYGISTEGYDDLKGIDIAGKVVIIFYRGEPKKDGMSLISKSEQASEWVRSRNKRIQNLKSKKPALILAINSDLEKSLSTMSSSLGEPELSLKKKAPSNPEADVIQ